MHGGTISYCVIKNANSGIYENGVSLGISNCAIKNCTNGIYLYSSSPSIQTNNIHNNSNAGVYLTSSSPTLYKNYLQNNGYGVYCTTSSNPKFGSGSTQGNNNVTGNSYGVFCWNNSLPMLGQNSPLSGGYDNLVNTSWNVYNMSGTAIYANNNWWGTTNSNNFMNGGTGTVLSSPYLSSSVSITAPPLSKTDGSIYASQGNVLPMLSELDSANQFIATNDLIDARKLCLNLVMNYPDYTVSYNALNLLKETFTFDQFESSKALYMSLFNNNQNNTLYAMAGLILSDIDKENKLALIDSVISRYKNASVVELALYDKFVYYYFEQQDMDNALAVSKELDNLFPSSQGACEAHRVLGDTAYFKIDLRGGGQNLKQNVVQPPTEYTLLGNYPNPFNPTTVITYHVTTPGQVSLKVYDVLGREVATLVNGIQSEGVYNQQFNGSHLSSGIYFYRLVAPGINETRKMLFAK